jgi:hypothetical protein
MKSLLLAGVALLCGTAYLLAVPEVRPRPANKELTGVAPFGVARLTLSAVPALRMACRCVGPSVELVPRAARYGRTSAPWRSALLPLAHHQPVGRATLAAPRCDEASLHRR